MEFKSDIGHLFSQAINQFIFSSFEFNRASYFLNSVRVSAAEPGIGEGKPWAGTMDSRVEDMVEVSRRIGGVQQRAAFDGETIHADLPCEFADELELLFAWGAIQANLIQRLCGAIVHDDDRIGNRTHPRVKRLASIGTFGYHGGNIRRDLLHYWNVSMDGLFKPAMVEIPFRKFRGVVLDTVHKMSLPILLVNELFEYIWERNTAMFLKLAGDVESFWNQVQHDDPRLVNNPLTEQPNWKTRAIPLLVHGDGAAFTMKNNSLLAVSFGFLLAPGWSWRSSFLMACFCAINKTIASVHGVGNGTWVVIWKYIAHAFQALLKGTHPLKDPYGNDWPVGSRSRELAGRVLCGGRWIGIVWCLAHDQEYGSNELGEAHFNATEPCKHCRCNRTDLSCRDCRPNASWKATCYDPAASPPMSNHGIYTIPGVGRFSHTGDLMHQFLLGPLLTLHGSTIACMCTTWGAFTGGNRESRVQAFWAALSVSYDNTYVKKRMQCITAKTIGKKWAEFPTLKSKASECKHLVVAMLDMLMRFLPTSGEWVNEYRHCRRCYQLAVRILEIIYENDMFLSRVAADELLDLTEKFQQHYHWLFVTASAEGRQQWKFTTKLHCLWHTMYFGRWLNPKASWCFSFEDFIGRIKDSAKACLHGTAMHNVCPKVVQNYVIVLHLMVQDKAWHQ